MFHCRIVPLSRLGLLLWRQTNGKVETTYTGLRKEKERGENRRKSRVLKASSTKFSSTLTVEWEGMAMERVMELAQQRGR